MKRKRCALELVGVRLRAGRDLRLLLALCPTAAAPSLRCPLRRRLRLRLGLGLVLGLAALGGALFVAAAVARRLCALGKGKGHRCAPPPDEKTHATPNTHDHTTCHTKRYHRTTQRHDRAT